VPVGEGRALSLVRCEGPPEARELVCGAVLDWGGTLRGHTVTDRRADGLERARAGGRGEAEGAEGAEGAAEQVSLDVVALGPEVEAIPGTSSHEDPKKAAEEVAAGTEFRVRLALALTAVDAQGRVITAGQRLEGVAHARRWEDALARARDRLGSRFASALSPRDDTRWREFDTTDVAQWPLLEAAQKGGLAEAADGLRAYARRSGRAPSAPAYYNLGVVLEARGDHAGAHDAYAEAVRRSRRTPYVEAYVACAGHLEDAPYFASDPAR
jgi:tetratricopeptide (TPR) repeat protein